MNAKLAHRDEKNWRGRARLALALAAAALLAAGAWVGWEAYGEPRWMTKRWGAVEPGLVYRSGRLPLALAQAVLPRDRVHTSPDAPLCQDGDAHPLSVQQL